MEAMLQEPTMLKNEETGHIEADESESSLNVSKDINPKGNLRWLKSTLTSKWQSTMEDKGVDSWTGKCWEKEIHMQEGLP